MTYQLSSLKTHGLNLLVYLMTLILYLLLASCDQYYSIAVVDSAPNSDDPPSESPDGSSDDGVDAESMERSMQSNPPIFDNYDDADTGSMQSDPPTAGNDDVSSDSADCPDRPIVTGCDPTKEGMCEGDMQCVVDQMASSPTGVCAFHTEIVAICFQSFATESCPATFTCWGGACRELCLCNGDCSTGRCCGEAVGSGGFRLCADC